MATPSRAAGRRFSPSLSWGRLPIHHRGTKVAPMRYICLPMPRPTFMAVAPKAGEAPVNPIDVWANQTQKSASWLGLDSPFFGATTIEGSWSVTVAEFRGRLIQPKRCFLVTPFAIFRC